MWFVYSCESRNVVANNAIICRFIKCKSVAQELRLQCGGCCCYCCCCFVFTSCHKFVTSHLFVVWTVKSVQNVRFMVNSQHYHVCLSVFLLNQKINGVIYATFDWIEQSDLQGKRFDDFESTQLTLTLRLFVCCCWKQLLSLFTKQQNATAITRCVLSVSPLMQMRNHLHHVVHHWNKCLFNW